MQQIEELSLGQISTIRARQVQDSYTVQEFVNEIMDLSRISILYHCPHTQERLIQIFFLFCDQMNTQKMEKSDVIKFIQAQRNENQKKITQQVQYYQQDLQKKVHENRLILSKLQFQKLLKKVSEKFLAEKRNYTIITDILLQKSKSSEFFSCIKILDTLREISKEVEEYQPSLSPEKILERRISQKPKALIEQQTQIFDQVANMLMNDPRLKIQNYFSYWKNRVLFLTDFIPDESARQEAQNLLENFKIHQKNIQQEVKSLIQQNLQSEKMCKQWYQAYQRAKLEKQIFEDAHEDYRNRISELNQIMTSVERQNKQKVEKIFHIYNQKESLLQELREMQKLCKEMEVEQKDQRNRYEVLQKQYQKIILANNFKSAIQKKPVIFQERTTKQKLDDAQHKIKRLEAQKEVDVEKLYQKDNTLLQKDNTIQLLQAKVAELSDQVNKKNKKTGELSKYRQPSMSSFFSRRDSIGSNINDESIIMRRSGLLKSGMKMSNVIQQVNSKINPNRRASIFLEKEQPNKATNLSRFKGINIAADDLPQIKEQNTNNFDISLLPPEQQITQVIKKDNSSIAEQVQNKSFMKKSTTVQVEHAQSTVLGKLQENKAENFMSKGVLINVLGVKYEVTLLLTHKRFCYFDMKLRLVRYLPIQNIKSFVFCKQNPTLFIVRPKNASSLNPKTYIVNPMIFSIRNRDRLAQYLTTKASKLIKQNQIDLFTKLQDDIFLSIDNKEINLKHKIPKMNNPYRLALSDQPVFYAKLQQEGLLTFKDNTIIVIQPMGLVCFKGEENYELEEKQQLLYYLPFNNCIMSQRENSREAPGRKLKLIYQIQQQKYFNIVFNTPEELKLFVQKCKQQQLRNKNYRITLNQNLDIMFKK